MWTIKGGRRFEDLAAYRYGDIRKMLVDYFQNVLIKSEGTLKKAFFKAARKEYGDPLVVRSEDEFHEFTDNFVYSYKFPDNLTVVDRFVSETHDLSEMERTIVLRWKDPVAGIFQVKRTFPDGFIAENLIPEHFSEPKSFLLVIRNTFSQVLRNSSIFQKKRY
jgi:hypothetical protein